MISYHAERQHDRNLETNSGYFHLKHQPIKISEDVLVPIYGYQVLRTSHIRPGMSGMMKNRSFSKSIADAAWSTLTEMISYKAEWADKEVFQIGRFFPSSKLCSCCGHKADKVPPKIREWACPSCDTVHDRDLNAATNIYKEGMLKLHGLISSVESLDVNSRGDLISPSWFLNQPKSGCYEAMTKTST